MKLKKRFVLTSKEDEEKNARLRRTLTLTVLFSSIIVPLLNDGVIYTLVEYTDSDVAVIWLNYLLRYTMVILRYLCTFVSFAAVITGIFHYGYKTFKTPPLLLAAGSFVKYLLAQFGSLVFCYDNGLINASETDVAAAGFEYFFLFVFDAVKNVALIIIFCRFAKKAREYGLPDCNFKPENSGHRPLFKNALNKSNPFLRVCLFAAGVQAVYDILSNFLSVTIFQLITDGLPEEGLNYLALLSGYILIIPLCALGFVISIILCNTFSYLKPAKRL